MFTHSKEGKKNKSDVFRAVRISSNYNTANTPWEVCTCKETQPVSFHVSSTLMTGEVTVNRGEKPNEGGLHCQMVVSGAEDGQKTMERSDLGVRE